MVEEAEGGQALGRGKLLTAPLVRSVNQVGNKAWTAEVDIPIRKNTFVKMDAILPVTPATLQDPSTSTHDELIRQALEASRLSLRWVQWRLGLLQQTIKDSDRLEAKAQIIALASLGTNFSRDIAVLSDKLRTSRDPLSSGFRRALEKALQLIRRNLYEESLIIDEGTAGRCDPKLWGGAMPFAAAAPWDPEPRVSVCAAWFPMNQNLHRDVITHEFFHLIGLTDKPIIVNTSDALDDADTMAQLVAYIHDRTRWEDSSGLSKPAVIYPAP